MKPVIDSLRRPRDPAAPPFGRPGLRLVSFLMVLATMAGAPVATADILRGNATRPDAGRAADARQQASGAAADAAHRLAQDRLRMSTQALSQMKEVQAAAQAAARSSRGVADGLGPRGLQPDAINPRWDGAALPQERQENGRAIVEIKQTQQQAHLNWSKFDVGTNTTLRFDQSKGEADVGKWIAFNRVNDPTGNPSQILGRIEAPGQVYIVNRNGIIFGQGSQVNIGTLVASALQINENLVQRGLLNHVRNAAEFLFSLPGATGEVVVEQGARISAFVNQDGSGGRVVLAAPRVENRGIISTPGGQTILAAGIDIGFDAHSVEYPVIPGRITPRGTTDDPSLRGIDVYVGRVESHGTAVNSGLIEIPTGSLIMAGRRVEQNGVVDSLTTVTLNGRVDLLANYDAIPNPSYDPNIAGQLAFLNRKTGLVRMGEGSVTRILPDQSTQDTTVGLRLPLKSQVNIQGNIIQFGKGAMLQAPNADIAIAAGAWRPIAQQQSERFTFTSGQIHLGSNSFIDASGSTGVRVAVDKRILEVELRASEMAVSPLQRGGPIRGIRLTIDTRRTGAYNGRFWIGTPLGDATGFVNVIQRTAGELTAGGGSVLIQSGGSVVAQAGSVIDVSGGFYRHEGGPVQTTLLRKGSRIIDIADATPDQIYDGVFTATWTRSSQKWGVSETYASPLAPRGARYEAEYVEGAAGGELVISAPALALDGSMRGETILGPLQLRGNLRSRSDAISSALPTGGRLKILFEGERKVALGAVPEFFDVSPHAPAVVFGAFGNLPPVGPDVVGDFTPLPVERVENFSLGADFFQSSGFRAVEIRNRDGTFTVSDGPGITLPARGRLAVSARAIYIRRSLRSPGGSLDFTAHHLSPYEIPIQQAIDPVMPQPEGQPGAGSIFVADGVRLDVSGSLIDDRDNGSDAAAIGHVVIDGGSISLVGHSVNLSEGSVLDVSGGLAVNPFGRHSYGNAGGITVWAGQDVMYPSALGGTLLLGAELRGYAGKNSGRASRGGSLDIKAPLIQIGGSSKREDTLALAPEFFNQGGFQRFVLRGIGARDTTLTAAQKALLAQKDPDAPEAFVPAVQVTPGTVIAPQVQGFAYRPNTRNPLDVTLRPLGERPAATVELRSSTVRNSFRDPVTLAGHGEAVVVRGDVVLSAGAGIRVEPGGSITLRGSTVTLEGFLEAPGGDIVVQGDRSFPLDKLLADVTPFARPTVHLGPGADISAAGASVPVFDPHGRNNLEIFPGGTINIAGNIVAQAGATLDVGGTSAIRDAHPLELGNGANKSVSALAGAGAHPYWLRTVPVRVDTDAGTITLAGHEMLVSDATLLGRAGGPTALGGVLAVSSGRFYSGDASQYGSDINMVVTQSGANIASTSVVGIGRALRDENNLPVPGMGYFAADTFHEGGFDSLDLGFNTDPGSGMAKGGNLEFRGPVDINARGFVRLASGGIMRADAPVRMKAAYLAIGQHFRATQTPAEESAFEFFERRDALPGSKELVAPTSGPGNFALEASLIDVGSLVFRNTRSVSLLAPGGDIRGSGLLNIRGDVTLSAAQIYPVSMANFFIAAYNPAGGAASVTIRQNGRGTPPLSAGGHLAVHAANILQGGTLLAPFGSIVLGWDGVDTDPSTPALEPPANAVVGDLLPIPGTSGVHLAAGSLTSVSGVDFRTGAPMLVPFGISPDGLTVVDPRGLEVTSSGLPKKSISIGAGNVMLDAGASIDLRGGGELYSPRWVEGIGGPVNILGTAGRVWSSGARYNAGDLVYHRRSGERFARMFSARSLIDPNDFFGAPPEPGINLYWTEVSESYAIVPGYAAGFAPIALFNTSERARLLSGNPGLVSGLRGASRTLRVGDAVTFDGSQGIPSGTYTLLPRAYAHLPGAMLVTPLARSPLQGRGFRSFTSPEGALQVAGQRYNSLHAPPAQSPLRSVFEVAPPDVLGKRAQYEVFDLSRFIADAAKRNDLLTAQERPADAGYLGLHGNSALRIDGAVLAQAGSGGRGGTVDLSSFAAITIGSSGNGVALNPEKLGSFGAESILVGGLRRFSADRVEAEVRAPGVTVANAGSPLRVSEVFFVAKNSLTFAPGSTVEASGPVPTRSTNLRISGDGVAALASGNSLSSITRAGTTASPSPLLTVSAGAVLSGASVVLDSSNSFAMDSAARIRAGSLKLGAGQISILTAGATPLIGQINPAATQLVLSGSVLNDVAASRDLTLLSYTGAVDIYGPGSFIMNLRGQLAIESAAVRGFGHGTGSTRIEAGSILLSNPQGTMAPGAGVSSGLLTLSAHFFRTGDGDVVLQGFDEVTVRATAGMLLAGKGSLSAQKSLRMETPALVVAQGAEQRISAMDGALNIERSGTSELAGTGLGGSLRLSGTTLRLFADVLAPSGRIEAESVGHLTVGGAIDARGTEQTFHDLRRFSHGGEILLSSQTGDVRLVGGSRLLVGAASGGGNAGSINILAPQGQFLPAGSFDGTGGANGRGGSFSLDAGGIASISPLRDGLNAGGFSETQNIRLRNGDIDLTGTIGGGDAWRARNLIFTADAGSINVYGDLDARGVTGGKISLFARENLTLHAGSLLTVAAQEFSSSGKGGAIVLHAGAPTHGVANLAGRVRILGGSSLDLSVAAFRQGATGEPNGSILDPSSSAFNGQFRGTLQIRAPQISGFTDVGVDALLGTILGASSVMVEGYRVYTPAGGVMNTALRSQIHTHALAFLGAPGVGNANESALRAKLLAGAPSAAAVAPVLALVPGVEIVNPAGDLTLGRANPSGSTAAIDLAEAHTAADWDLSGFRYGSMRAPGVLTLRARGDLIFNNTLSDGFSPVPVTAASGFSRMWLAPLMYINPALPVNTQSWSYRLTAGGDLASANAAAVLPAAQLAAGKGSVLVGEFYPAILNPFTSGTAAGAGPLGTTAASIRFVSSASDAVNRGTRFEVVRTGTGDIAVNAGRDVQLRNQFATIYTAGVALPTPTRIFAANDFVLPIIHRAGFGITPTTPDGNLGVPQQNYGPLYSTAGGNLFIHAGRDIGRFTFYNGAVVADTSRQLPTNWLHRRGYVDETGAFGLGGVTLGNVNDVAASTTWWVNFSNFFQGFGALGGGDVGLSARRDLINADAVIPTNARMAGRREIAPGVFENLAPSASNLHELGGGDLRVRAGRNIDGGSFYLERGEGSLFAGGEITTNSARSPSKGILAGAVPVLENALTWLPTTLYVGKSHFDVAARGNLLLGPVTNPSLLPQGMNNRFWYKTQFNTFSPGAGANVISYSGDVTHRLDVTLMGDHLADPVLYYWARTQNVISPATAAHNQPWVRLAESGVDFYITMFGVGAPNLRSTALGGNINLVGRLVLYPSATGILEVAAAKGLPGLQPSGVTTSAGIPVTAWTSATIAQSDADPSRIPGVTNPLAFQSIVKSRSQESLLDNFNRVDPLAAVRPSFLETGAVEGPEAAVSRQNALHSPAILHKNNPNPFRVYAMDGDITALKVYAANIAKIHAARDINDIAFYLQNPTPEGISTVSAGRDIIPFNENSPLRSVAGDASRGNIIVDAPLETSAGTFTRALAGDIQIGGQGALQVLAGRNIDLGTGPNLRFGGLGRGITSVGRARNPFLPVTGAEIIALSGVTAPGGGAAPGLFQSNLHITEFIGEFVGEGGQLARGFSTDLDAKLEDFASATNEGKAAIALEVFFEILKQAAREAAEGGGYDTGYAAAEALFGSREEAERSRLSEYGWAPWKSEKEVESFGQIFTRVRDIRTTRGGGITLMTPGGGISMAPSIFGNPLTPPGIVTEFGGPVSIFMEGDLDIGLARIFTLRGGDLTIWSSSGSIAAGAAPKTVVTAPPTRVSVDRTSALVQTDLGGLATGGGIGVLAAVDGVEPGEVFLIAPLGTVDAGDAGIRATGDITIAAAVVVNVDNIAAGGVTVGAAPPAPVSVPAPAVPAGTTPTAATTAADETLPAAATQAPGEVDAAPSIFTVEVLGYGGEEEEEEEEEEEVEEAVEEDRS